MASANVRLVRSICAAWERGDYSSVEWAHDEFELVIPDGPEPGRWIGPAGLADGFRGFLTAWAEYHSEAQEYRELAHDRVLVLTYATARGKTSGLELRQMRANLFHVRGGKIARLVAYWDRERAFADLGLASSAGGRGE
jgi:ketosteroid isomerase-like protein